MVGAYTIAMSKEVTEARKKLAIIDGKSVFYRGYYAMPNLSTKDGTPTGGVYGFAAMSLELIKKLKPDYVCVAWDKPKTNIRKRLEMYPEYKAGRKPAPADFYEQIPLLQELLAAFGWPLYELDDYEADDIMGALAVQARKQDIETMLITSDLDALQLINSHVHVYALKKGFSNIELFHPESFVAKYGLDPSQFLDLKALKGDSSDNIPGVSGIGEKGAIELLKNFKTLDGVYENIELVKESTRRKLVEGKEMAYLSKKLAAIWTDAPVPLKLQDMNSDSCDPLRVKEVLHKLEFRSLEKQLPEYMHIPGDTRSYGRSVNMESLAISEVKDPKELSKLTVDKHYYALARFNGSNSGGIEQLAIVGHRGEAVLLDGDQLSQPSYQKALSDKLLSDNNLKCVSINAKALLKGLWQKNLSISNDLFDLQIAAFLLDPLGGNQMLAALAREWLNIEIELETRSVNEQIATELEVMRQLHKAFAASFAKPENNKLLKVFEKIDMLTVPVLADMEQTGILLDTDSLKLMSSDVSDMISDFEQQIYGYADQEFNINSPAQLADVLFKDLKLPRQNIKKGKTGYSTAASELEKLRGTHPIVELISQYREVAKLKNTYIDTLPKLVDKSSRLHTTFNIMGAQTGRLSSADPNLQNIPVRTELGKQIRTAFVASPGNVLVSADYSQFELRLAAVLANDKELIEMFNHGADVHTMTASQVYGREPEEISKQMRRDAKIINFGVLYGMSPHGLSVATGMTREQAKAYIDKYFELRKPLLDYLNAQKAKARSEGYVETIFGRRRPMPDIKSSNFVVRTSAERAAMNMPIQGTEADLMKMSMIAVHKKLKGTDCKMLLQIHDSILVECPEDKAKETAASIKQIMESIYKLPVYLTVDISIGRNWGEL